MGGWERDAGLKGFGGDGGGEGLGDGGGDGGGEGGDEERARLVGISAACLVELELAIICWVRDDEDEVRCSSNNTV